MGNTQLFSLKNFMKYCWLYSSILLRNQSQFPAEHFPSYTRKTDSQTVDSAKTSISLVTSPLYSRIFFCFAIVIIPFFNLCEPWGSYSFLSLASLIRLTSNNIFFYLIKKVQIFLYIKIYVQFFILVKAFHQQKQSTSERKIFQKQLL